ncbi:MAG TPA: hypothetical protein PLQ01_09850 [Methanothrix sp.]|nr:hypothetical protein [Methanothrix sp.]
MRQYILALLLCMVLPCAAGEVVTTGNYSVSFDIGLPEDTYTINVRPVYVNETLSGVVTETNNIVIRDRFNQYNGATIAIMSPSYANEQDLMSMLHYVEATMDNCKLLLSTARKIDGENGMVGQYKLYGSGQIFYVAFYLLPHNVLVEVLSSYPQDTFIQILRTLHVTSSPP